MRKPIPSGGQWMLRVGLLLCFLFGALASAGAQEGAAPAAEPAAPPIDTTQVALDTVWTLFCAFLVMFMALGFALLESGFCRAKNTANILAKNFVVYAITSIAFLMVGFGFMFGEGNGFIGYQGLWFLTGADNSPAKGDAYQGVYGSLNWTGIPLTAKFLFQMVFAATGATIVSGAVAERIKFPAFFLFSILIGGVIYPIVGHWIWGGGWLAEKGMLDFAGSTVVHSVGGWAALAGVLVLGPRIGKFRDDGRVNPIPGHSLTSATIGVFVLWFGWFGFNPGSAMAADFTTISHVAVTTNTAAAAGAVAATFTAWALLGKPDLTMALNGGVAGLVAITCPCAFVSVGSSVFIGLIAGSLIVFSVLFFDKIRVDDPVGAISAHMVCGIWGTLSLGLFGQKSTPQGGLLLKDGLFFGGGSEQFIAQLTGVVAVGGFVFFASIVGWAFLKAAMGIRVAPDAETEGLDLSEHGNVAYADFAIRAGHEPSVFTARATSPPAREPLPVGAGPAARSMREPPSPARHTEPPRRPPAPPLGAGGSSSSATSGGPFTVSVADVDRRFVEEMWNDLCRKYHLNPQSVPAEFAAIYPQVQSFSGATWKFARGDAEDSRYKLERILSSYGVEYAHVTVSSR